MPIQDGQTSSSARAASPNILTLALANRHGLVTGATGTGKTVTLQVLAEGFSRAGVPVFAADIKGDLSGIAAVGEAKDALRQARQGHGLRHTSPTNSRSCSGTCSASRAIRSAPPSRRWGRCCCRACWISTTCRKACSTSPSASPTSRACCCSTSRTCARSSAIVAEHAAETAEDNTATSRRRRSAPSSAQLLVLENQGADKFFGEPALDTQGLHAHRPRRPRHHQHPRRRQADAEPAALRDLPAVAAVGAVRGTARGRRSATSRSSCSSSTRRICCSTTRPRRCSKRSSRWCG